MFNLFNKKQPRGLVAPDPTDPRDYQLAELQPEAVDLPDTYLLRDKMIPIGRQNYGSCTAWASTAVKEYWDSEQHGKIVDLSEKFVYHNTKKISQLWSIEGDYLRNAVKSVVKFGAPLTKYWPDTRDGSWEKYVKNEPPKEIYEKAEKYKGGSYWSVEDELEPIRQAIYKNKAPVALGLAWYDSYHNTENGGKLPMPSSDKPGGHAIACVGWENEKLWFRNSWGTSYGDDGYFYVPFNEFDFHAWWNPWIMLDLEEEDLVGWVAGKYLEEADVKFQKGDLVRPTVDALNVRALADLQSKQISQVSDEHDLEIIGGPEYSDGYYWYRIKKL